MKLFRQSVLNKQVILVTLLVLGLIVSSSLGQYELSWYTVDGGGGQISGGDYELTTTIGQPEAGAASGGDYELLGGFWPGGPLCFVDFEHYARFAEHWLREPCNEGNNFCDGADLYVDENNIVNRLDLRAFVEQWLCYCPAEWPLK